MGQPAAVQRETATTNAVGQAALQSLELCDPLVNSLSPVARQLRPVLARGHAVLRQRSEFVGDLVECEPDSLREYDECDPSQHAARVSPVARAGALRRDQPAVLVEAQRGGGDAAPPCDFADRHEIWHRSALTEVEAHVMHRIVSLTSSSLELVRLFHDDITTAP